MLLYFHILDAKIVFFFSNYQISWQFYDYSKKSATFAPKYTFLNKNHMKTLEKIFAAKLLNIKAIKLQPENPFTWASGWKSPFYCDNRKTLSYPDLRNFVKLEICRIIEENFS